MFYLVLPVAVARVKALKADDQLMLASLCVSVIDIAMNMSISDITH